MNTWLLLAIGLASVPDDRTYPTVVQPYLVAHCVKCHGPDKQAGGVRVDDLTADPKHAERWSAVRDQLRDGLMPPPKEPRPDAAQGRAVVAWASATVGIRPSAFPNQGNLIPHELLFGKPAEKAEPAAPRVWRLSPDAYLGLVREVSRARVPGLIQPFTMVPERGIKDFAGLYTIDEPSTEILVRNAEAIVLTQTAHELRDGKIAGKNDTIGELVKLMDPANPPTRAQVEAAIQLQFRLAVGRPADAEEVPRFVALYDRALKAADSPTALKTTLQAVLLRTDAMFRRELGTGAGGRRMLAPDELVRSLSLALADRRDATLVQAAQKGELKTPEQIAAQIRRMLDDPKIEKPRVLRFFREFFEYHRAEAVFKDKPKTFVHEPRQLVADTDRLVLHVLEADKDVLRQLLTTPASFVNYSLARNKQKNMDEPKPGVVLNPTNKKGQTGVESVYGLEKWQAEQPVRLPEGTRLGILMQPSWLVAWSTNFENDPVRRGRWIRERLLGGNVPDLPIGVVAQVPDEPHRTYRDRLTVTRDARCWKCHQRMDELGLPFEQFDHYGRFRTTENVIDPEATAKNVDKRGKSLGPVLRDADLVTTGVIADSGDAAIDGPVSDPRAMLRKLGDSERVRQVFIRHVFRYFLGRNETLADARTLQEADRSYVASGGSFKTLLVSILTSEAFLYRQESR